MVNFWDETEESTNFWDDTDVDQPEAELTQFEGDIPNALPGEDVEFEEIELDDTNLIEYLESVPEVAKSLIVGGGSSMIGYAGGFMEQLFKEVVSGDFFSTGEDKIESSKRIERNTMMRMAEMAGMFAPESEAGKEMVKDIGEAASVIPPLVPYAGQLSTILQASKAAAPILTSKLAMYQAAPYKQGPPALINTKTGLPNRALAKAMNKRDVKHGLLLEDPKSLPAAATKRTADEVVDSVIAKRINQGSSNESLAHLKLDHKGRVVDDMLGVEAVKQGIKPGDVSMIKNTNAPTKNIMKKMTVQKRKIQGSSDAALDMRPSKFVGEELMKRFKVVRDNANRLRDKLNAHAKTQLKGKKIDVSYIEKAVFDGLKELDIKIPEIIKRNSVNLKSYLKQKGVFEGSDISKDLASQKVIIDTIELLAEKGPADALRAHKLKRQIDKMLDFDRIESRGLVDSGENFSKGIRRALNDSIREVDTTYAKINDDLSLSLKSMETVQRILPKNTKRQLNLFKADVSEEVGQELRKLLSNYNIRGEMNRAVEAMDDTAKYFGVKFDTDVKKLSLYNQVLDDRFGATGRGTFQAQVASGTAEGVAKAIDPKSALKEVASQKILDAINKYRHIDDEEAFNVITKLLSE